ncbi:MAG: hypothetical protein PHQ32_02475 [Firmicutes bacterium]|nr:hypothetical protein [Bacillota bacterium]
MMKYQMPPLGLKPKYIHNQQRIIEIREAIYRYIDKCYPLPTERIEEWN